MINFCQQFSSNHPTCLDVTANSNENSQVDGFTCLDCNKQFKSKGSLCKHQKEFHSSLREIHNCGKAFSRKSNLEAHEEVMHKGEGFPCKHCNQTFPNRHSRRTHIYLTHEISSEAMPVEGYGEAVLPDDSSLENLTNKSNSQV